jgi:hypothetical protein
LGDRIDVDRRQADDVKTKTDRGAGSVPRSAWVETPPGVSGGNAGDSGSLED